MTIWFEEAIEAKLKDAGNHVILVPARNPNAPLDTVDVFDGITGSFLAADVPEESAREFMLIWNGLVDRNENTEEMKNINLAWLAASKSSKYRK